MTHPLEGQPAPDFAVPHAGGTFRLSEMVGRPVVLFFYPKDGSGSCTNEAKDFSRLLPDFTKAGAAVFGISPDSAKSHDKFKAKQDLAVELLADEDLAAISAYGAWGEKSMYGRTFMGVLRSTFLIDAGGRIAKAWPQVKVPGHAEAVLEAVQAL